MAAAQGADAEAADTARLLSGEAASAVPAPLHALLAFACTSVAGAPLWAWAQLAFATLAVSTAGTVFLFARDVPPFLLAGWRLMVVTLLLAPAAHVQWRAADAEQRARWRESGRRMVASGAALAAHFGLWVTSVQTTALTHALLFVSATPLVLAAVALARRVPLSRGELAGSAAAVLGGSVLVSDAKSDTSVTLSGDLCAFAAAAAFALYLSIGSDLRAWMPLFLYAVPVNGTAAGVLLLSGMAFEGASPFGAGARGLFGFLNKGRYSAVVFFLAIVPGILGHTSFNAVLTHISPLVMTVVLTTEPLIGSLFGYAVGVSGAPHARTFIGGLILMASTLLVVYAEAKRKAAEEAQKAQAEGGGAEAVPAPKAEDGGGGEMQVLSNTHPAGAEPVTA